MPRFTRQAATAHHTQRAGTGTLGLHTRTRTDHTEDCARHAHKYDTHNPAGKGVDGGPTKRARGSRARAGSLPTRSEPHQSATDRTKSGKTRTRNTNPQPVRRDGTRPGFWDVRPTRADRSTATKLRVLTPLKDGSAVYLRYQWDRGEKPLPKFQVLRPLHFPLPTVPHRPTGGTIAIRPTFRITYSLRDRPDGTPRARDRFPSRGNTLGRLSLAQGRPHRPYTRTRTYTR